MNGSVAIEEVTETGAAGPRGGPSADTTTISRGLLFKTLATVSGGLLTLLLSILLTRHFGKERYGLLVLVFSVTNLLASLSELGAKGTLNRFLPPALQRGETARIGALLRSACWWQLCGLGLVTFVLGVIARPLATRFFHRPELIPLLRVGVLYAAGLALTDFLFVAFQSMERWRVEAALTVGYAALYVAFTLAAIWGFRAGLSGVLLANALAAAVILLIGYLRLPEPVARACRQPIAREELARSRRDTIQFGGPLVLINLNFMIMMWFDKILLGRYLPLAALTHYYIAFLVLNAMMMVVKVLFTVLMPVLARQDARATETAERFNRLVRWFLQFGIFGGIVAFFLAEPFILSAYGPDSQEAVRIFRWMLLVFIVRTAYQPVGMFLVNVLGQTARTLRVSILHTVLLVGASVLLIKPYGVAGAIASSLIAWSGSWAGSLIFFPELRRLIDWARGRRAALACAGLAVSAAVIVRSGVPAAAACPLVVAAYATLLLITREWRRDDWFLMRRVLTGFRRALAVPKAS